jgi:hypothetical protein
MSVTDDALRGLRGARATPRALAAADPERKRVFQSALAQFEELWEAAQGATAATRPLTLFYAVSQATRALCAEWHPGAGTSWSPRGHGLTALDDSLASDDPLSLQVKPTSSGAFRMLNVVMQSEEFDGPVTLRELWASLPDMPRPETILRDQPTCLAIYPTAIPTGSTASMFAETLRPTTAVIYADRDDLDTVLRPYPRAGDLEFIASQGTNNGAQFFTGSVVRFRGPNGYRSLDMVAEPGQGERFREQLYLRPGIGSNAVVPTQLSVVWALLLGFSSLARYHPAVWVAALNPDESPQAVHLEHGLGVLLDLAPYLLLAGLRYVKPLK